MRLNGEISYRDEEEGKNEMYSICAGFPQPLKLVVGYALTSKKIKSFLQPKLESLARNKGILFVAIDQNRPLSDQGPFDIVLHKLSGKEWGQILEDYRQKHPEVTVLDPPDAIQHVHNRQSMLQDVADLNLSDCYVAKPLVVDDSSKSHELSLAYDQYSLSKLEPPLVLQEFVNHGGVLFKVYIVGEAIKVVRRYSLPDVSKCELSKSAGVYRFPRVSCAAASADDADLDPCIAELPPRPLLERLAKELRRRLGLRLFNIDIIREHGTRDRFYVIDINYFPGKLWENARIRAYIYGLPPDPGAEQLRVAELTPSPSLSPVFFPTGDTSHHRNSSLPSLVAAYPIGSPSPATFTTAIAAATVHHRTCIAFVGVCIFASHHRRQILPFSDDLSFSGELRFVPKLSNSPPMAMMNMNPINPKARRVCFSFAAYAKNVIDHLKTCKIPVGEGLTDEEFSSIEASFGFCFPPDLRSILREGLPVGPGFPNWRLSSPQQLEILINLPILGICKEISKGNFWRGAWGDEPDNPEEAIALAKQFMNKAPVLVPIYRHCYIPSTPKLAGNPVFFVQGGDIRYSGFDVADFFQQVEFRQKNSVLQPVSPLSSSTMKAPAWAATAARNIEFWSDLVDDDGTCGKRHGTCERGRGRLEGCFEEMSWRLREGGWTEEEVREMMMADDQEKRRVVLRDKESVVWHVRLLSLTLLQAGWSSEDVVYSLGLRDEGGLPEWSLC
ncbi:hypothetical protein HHK36_031078 [Tetracentron sinense]|uniref:Uncharacterized protein n=1 Tax=Tetracentron sinense TaxID=13715 RepID=A0A834YDY8_TETSI|nr:hypothetical protein HHK36_031078 [Tetracentron sinense]